MSYKPSIVKFYEIRNKKLLEGEDTVLLAKKNDKFYRVTEHIGQITKIYPKQIRRYRYSKGTN